MKKRVFPVLISFILLIGMLTAAPSAAAGKLTFISINDTLPPELINCVSYTSGGTYVPYYIFSNYGFGISASTNSDNALTLSSGDRTLYFDLDDGSCHDGDDYHYSVSAFSRNGTMYVPLGFVCRFFGTINYSTIAGNDYGSILRLTTTGAVLTDAEFLRAAENAMRTFYNNYQSGNGTSPIAPEDDSPLHQNDRILMRFVGIPSDATLNLLSQNHVKATVFLTAEDIMGAPDTVRRISCEGHTLGVYCESDLATEYEECAALLFEVCRANTILVSSGNSYADACREQSEMAGLVYCDANLDLTGGAYSNWSPYNIFTQLNSRISGASLRVSGDSADTQKLRQLLNYLSPAQFDMDATRETD